MTISQEKTLTRVMIETIVRKALRDVSDSPERTIRNLVDMAQQFSKGRFQDQFFRTAQIMLQNESSPYYRLVRDVCAHVDPERLLTFGMNLGYNGCTLGAKKIREIEAAEGFNIPWAITLRMPDAMTEDWLEDYQRLLGQGETLGIHVFFLFAKDAPEKIISLATAHPDSAFVLFWGDTPIGSRMLDEVGDAHNVMLAVPFSEAEEAQFAALRARKLLFGAYLPYDEQNVQEVLSGNAVEAMQQFAPVSILVAADGCSKELWQSVHRYALDARRKQLYHTVLWELTLDTHYVDTVISGDACSAGFTEEGWLYTPGAVYQEPAYNLHQAELAAILKQAFPKG